jgi:hypothetical protein
VGGKIGNIQEEHVDAKEKNASYHGENAPANKGRFAAFLRRWLLLPGWYILSRLAALLFAHWSTLSDVFVPSTPLIIVTDRHIRWNEENQRPG